MLINLKSRNRLFWILQTSGWLLYLVFFLIVFWSGGHLTRESLTEYSVSTGIGFVVTLSLRFFYRKIKIQDHSIFSLSLRSLVYSFLGANAAVWISIVVQNAYSKIELSVSNPLIRYLALISIWIGPFIGWSALYFGIKFWQEWMIQKERAEKARTLAETAQLQMLRYRMNPHFLFNTLNSIRALISENKTSAKTMITELSDYLRYALLSKNYENVPFKDEMESIRHYFNVQKMRYENKLEVTFDVDPEADEYPIVSFLLHPLAENALKYGMLTSPLPLKIQINAKARHGDLQIEVINSGSWIKPSGQEKDQAVGRGLDNIRRRLADAYPRKHRFEISEKEGAVCVRLAIGEGRGGNRPWTQKS